jgi:hypothetical protein
MGQLISQLGAAAPAAGAASAAPAAAAAGEAASAAAAQPTKLDSLANIWKQYAANNQVQQAQAPALRGTQSFQELLPQLLGSVGGLR